jgi:cytochrome c peroxidase
VRTAAPARPDPGRAPATAQVEHDEFNCLGAYSDAPKTACQELRFMVSGDAASLGAFKTPGLRNVAQRAPYMHAGQFASLDEVIAHYVASPTAALGHSELAHARSGSAHRQPIQLSAAQARDLAAFLHTLSGPIVETGTAD